MKKWLKNKTVIIIGTNSRLVNIDSHAYHMKCLLNGSLDKSVPGENQLKIGAQGPIVQN